MSQKFVDFFHKTVGQSAAKRGMKAASKAAALAAKAQGLQDTELKDALTEACQQYNKGKNTDALPTMLAYVAEGSFRALGLKPYPVQLAGASLLLEGKLVEMQTGEGKTLVVALASTLAALSHGKVHVVTANEYLAERDCEFGRPLLAFFGLQAGITVSRLSSTQKAQNYQSQVIYGVNHEFGFDYLKDNMVTDLTSKIMGPMTFAIVDEIDSILIDEARTPLVISGLSSGALDMYSKVDAAVRGLSAHSHYLVDEKEKQVTLTEEGYNLIEQNLVELGLIANPKDLYEPFHLGALKQISKAMLAHVIYKKDVDYMVANGEVHIIDPSTGRIADGRRWSEGLHQAVEAKEGLVLKPDNVSRATITYQTFFKMYGVLSGLTGTAATEAEEFQEIYGLTVVPLPTHRPIARKDLQDMVFRTKAAKRSFVATEIIQSVQKGQPVLVGTADVAESDALSAVLTQHGIAHEVLNAKNHEREAHIIENAGRPGAVTIATNMAGRGTDIVLGGLTVDGTPDKEQGFAVKAAGGLKVIGTERHESRRIDNQLRGRSGRQGDPGETLFCLSLEDDLLRVFGEGKLSSAFNLVAGQSDGPVSSPIISKFVRKAQEKLEQQRFESRKNLLKFDGPVTEQRLSFYAMRDELLSGENLEAFVEGLLADALVAEFEIAFEDKAVIDFESDSEPLGVFKSAVKSKTGVNIPALSFARKNPKRDGFIAACLELLLSKLLAAEDRDGKLKELSLLCLFILDEAWVSHLTELEEMRHSSALQSYAQKSSTLDFQKKSFEAFSSIRPHLCERFLAEAFDRTLDESPKAEQPKNAPSEKLLELRKAKAVAAAVDARWVLRNETCPCGSGKKFKKCHGALPVVKHPALHG